MKKEKHLEINENNYKGYVELYKTKLITPDREKKETLKSTLIGLGFMFVIPFISISFFKLTITFLLCNLVKSILPSLKYLHSANSTNKLFSNMV